MIGHRTASEVRNFDIFKFIVLVILLLLLAILLIFRPFQAAPSAAVGQPDSSADTGRVEVTEPEVRLPSPPTLVAPDLTNLSSGDNLPLTGTAEPGSELQIIVNDRVVDTITVGNDGSWSYDLGLPEAGPYRLGLNTLDANGQVVASAPSLSFDVGAAAAAEETAPEATAEPEESAAVESEPAPAADAESGAVVTEEENEAAASETAEASEQAAAAEADSEPEAAVEPAEGEDAANVAAEAATTADGDSEPEAAAEPAEGDSAAEATAETATPAEGERAAGESGSAASQPAAGPVCEQEYVVVADDWLSKLADKYWGDIWLYPAIVTATNQKQSVDQSFASIDNVDLIEPGWKLCIVDSATATGLVEAGD